MVYLYFSLRWILVSWEALDTGSRPSPRHLRHVLQAARDRDQFDQVLDLFALFRARRGNSLDSQTSDALSEYIEVEMGGFAFVACYRENRQGWKFGS